jgi:hypothetical protein
MAEAETPVFLVGFGRGRTGKSTTLNWAIGRARAVNRKIIVADGDRSNATLATYYPDASRPRSAEDEDVRVWLTGLLDIMAEERQSLALDLGGGDRTLASFGRDLALVEFCQAVGARPVALHLVGPHLQDLAHIEAMEDSGVFQPENTAVVLNEGLVPPGHTVARAFESLMEQPGLQALVERGARVVRMPRLGCMKDIEEQKAGFFDIPNIGPAKGFMLKDWRKNMEKSFSSIAEWLP